MVISEIIKTIVETKSLKLIRYVHGSFDKTGKWQYDVKDFGEDSVETGWILIDLQTANAMLTVYNALRVDLQEKFDTLPLSKLVGITWKSLKAV